MGEDLQYFNKYQKRKKTSLYTIFGIYLKGQCHEIFDFGFFHESVSRSP
jgi:hypothetical protein